jgi:SAM-dependent methyltransferase
VEDDQQVLGDAETSRRSLNTPEAWSERAQIESPYEAVMWSPEGQRERHDAVIRALNPKLGETFLDFGCGTGELCTYLQDGDGYVGYDWSYPMVQRARHDHPGYKFLSTLPYEHYDLVACVGTFNLPGSFEETWKTINSLWERTKRALAASLYDGNDERCLQYDEYDLCDFVAGKTQHWRIERIRHNDLLLVMWK